MKTKLTLTLITLAGLIVTSSAAAVVVDDKVNPHYKGGSSFNLAGAGPTSLVAEHFRKTSSSVLRARG